jgi:hypothetical protein
MFDLLLVAPPRREVVGGRLEGEKWRGRLSEKK